MDMLAITGTRYPSSEMTELCRKVAVAFRALGWGLVTGNAKGIDSVARDAWNEKFPERVTLVLPWPDYNRDRIHPANKVLVYHNQRKWYASVEQYHPAPGRLSDYAVKLHARNYGIVELADVVVAFPNDGKEGGGTGQGIRVARGLGKKLFVLPGDLDRLRQFYRQFVAHEPVDPKVKRLAAIAASLVNDIECGDLDVALLPESLRRRLLKALSGGDK